MINELRNGICRAVDENFNDLAETLQALIRFPSTYGREEAAQQYFAGRLAALGSKVDLWEPDPEEMKDHPAYISARTDYHGSPDVAAQFPGSGGGRSLILCGHMDVVEPGDNDWTYPPFSGAYVDGKIYGRGAADMKSGQAANLLACKALQDCGVKLNGDLTVLSVIDEECGSTGILSAILRGYTADAAIVTEPTGMELFMASVAGIFYRIKVPGRSAHGGMAYLGVNSIYKAMKVINQIRELEEARRLRVTHPLYQDHPIPFCLGVNRIQGGDWPCIVPEETILEGRICASPDETVEEVKKELEDAVADIAASDSWLKEHPPVVEYYPYRWNSGQVPLDHPLGLILQQNSAAITGKASPMTGMPASSDSGTLLRFGNTPAINFGCSPLTLAHKADEFAAVKDLNEFIKVLALSIIDWCGCER